MATDYASPNLDLRIGELQRQSQPPRLSRETKIVQFLRGASTRASYVLPALYMQVGAHFASGRRNSAYNQRVLTEYARFSSVTTLSLACRAVFDDGNKGLTAKSLVSASSEVVRSVASIWSRMSGRTIDDAQKALVFLQRVFKHCAHQPKQLLTRPSLLARRVGLIIHHADHEAAHISIDPYLLDVVDLIHVVAAMSIIGAIIHDFDDPKRGNGYFDAIDRAAWDAARVAFPELPGSRLFGKFCIHEQGSLCWKTENSDGLNMLLNELPGALGYRESTSDAPNG